MGMPRAAQALAPRAGHPQGGGPEAYLERYVAGLNTRGRPGGRPYPRSQQAIHEISGLGV